MKRVKKISQERIGGSHHHAGRPNCFKQVTSGLLLYFPNINPEWTKLDLSKRAGIGRTGSFQQGFHLASEAGNAEAYRLRPRGEVS